MRYHKTDVIGRFWLHRIADISVYPHKGLADEGRVLYSSANEKLYYGGKSEWKVLTSKYDVLSSNTTMLLGSFPLPQNWNISVKNDLIINLTNISGEIGATGGNTWYISGMDSQGTHDHGGSTRQANLPIGQGTSRISSTVDSNTHIHDIFAEGGHTHNFNGTWRPAYTKMCEAVYQ